MLRQQARYVWCGQLFKGQFLHSLYKGVNELCKQINSKSIYFLLIFQTLNIPDAYKDERFDPSVSTRF